MADRLVSAIALLENIGTVGNAGLLHRPCRRDVECILNQS